MQRRGRMMVLPGCDRVSAYAGIGAREINGEDFAATRRRAYRVCRSVWAWHNLVPRVRSGRGRQRGRSRGWGERRQRVAGDVHCRRFLMETARRWRASRSGRRRGRVCGWLQPRTARCVRVVWAAVLLHLRMLQIYAVLRLLRFSWHSARARSINFQSRFCFLENEKAYVCVCACMYVCKEISISRSQFLLEKALSFSLIRYFYFYFCINFCILYFFSLFYFCIISIYFYIFVFYFILLLFFSFLFLYYFCI